MEPINSLGVEGSGLYGSKGHVNMAARCTDKIRIIQVYAICPGVWPFYSALRIGNQNHKSPRVLSHLESSQTGPRKGGLREEGSASPVWPISSGARGTPPWI